MTVIGIDIGGSTTKIVGIRDGKVLSPLQVKATDPVTSVYGAFGRYVSENTIKLEDITTVKITGVGSGYIKENIYGIRTERVDEFDAIGRGGLSMTGLPEAIIVSMGTGTAFVHANGSVIEHVGGTGVGGGTLLGLSGMMLDVRNFESIEEMASEGDLSHIDLTVGDFSTGSGNMPLETTAANFGNVSDYATKEDKALGLFNMIYQTVGLMAAFIAKSYGITDIVLCGNLSNVSVANKLFDQVAGLHGVKFHIPDGANFITALGTALS